MWYLVQDQLAISGLYYNFMPSWWQRNYGLSFGERFVFDPDYRVDLYRFMERTVSARFPGMGIGSPDPMPQVIPPDFGNALTAALAGCEVVYPEDNYPWNHHLPAAAVARLEPPRCIEEAFPYSEILRQTAYLNRKLDQDVWPGLRSRGVLNDAMLIGGPDFFTGFAEDAPAARTLVDYAYRVLMAVLARNQAATGPREMVMLTNCVVMMISPAMYRSRLLSLDLAVQQMASTGGQTFGIHHCGNFERYAAAYRQIPHIDWLEIGWGSDVRTALECFPEAVVQYILSAVFVASATREQVREKISAILEEARGHWHRFRLSMPDVEYGTPDENLFEICTVCRTARQPSRM